MSSILKALKKRRDSSRGRDSTAVDSTESPNRGQKCRFSVRSLPDEQNRRRTMDARSTEDLYAKLQVPKYQPESRQHVLSRYPTVAPDWLGTDAAPYHHKSQPKVTFGPRSCDGSSNKQPRPALKSGSSAHETSWSSESSDSGYRQSRLPYRTAVPPSLPARSSQWQFAEDTPIYETRRPHQEYRRADSADDAGSRAVIKRLRTQLDDERELRAEIEEAQQRINCGLYEALHTVHRMTGEGEFNERMSQCDPQQLLTRLGDQIAALQTKFDSIEKRTVDKETEFQSMFDKATDYINSLKDEKEKSSSGNLKLRRRVTELEVENRLLRAMCPALNNTAQSPMPHHAHHRRSAVLNDEQSLMSVGSHDFSELSDTNVPLLNSGEALCDALQHHGNDSGTGTSGTSSAHGSHSS